MKTPERVKTLMEKEIPPSISWIGQGILTKRGTCLVGGAEKIGKSWIALEIARALVTGTHVFGHPQFHTEPCRVLYIEQEIGELQLQKRVSKVMEKEDPAIWEDRYWYMSQSPELRLDTHAGRTFFTKALEMTQPNVLVLDPIKNLHGADENDNTAVAELFSIFDNMKSMFVHNDMSIIFAHHFRKAPQEKSGYDPLSHQNFRGANNWTASPDTLWTVHRSRELEKPYTAWETMNRVLLRNDTCPADFRCTVNRDNDLRVRFDGEKGKLLPLKQEAPPVTLRGEQKKMGFISDL